MSRYGYHIEWTVGNVRNTLKTNKVSLLSDLSALNNVFCIIHLPYDPDSEVSLNCIVLSLAVTVQIRFLFIKVAG